MWISKHYWVPVVQQSMQALLISYGIFQNGKSEVKNHLLHVNTTELG
jgi:hypothetical protein